MILLLHKLAVFYVDKKGNFFRKNFRQIFRRKDFQKA
jgi:hypothetical protein